MNQTPEIQITAVPTTAVVPKDISNGVTRPKAGTVTARVWEICGELSAIAGSPADRAHVINAGISEGINAATIATQHGRWRKYHGLVADTPEAKAEKAAAAAKVKAEKEAAAKAKKEAAVKAKAAAAEAKAAEAKAAEAKAVAEVKEVVETAIEDDISIEDDIVIEDDISIEDDIVIEDDIAAQ